MFMRIDCWIDWLAYDGGWTSDKALRADYTSQAVGMDTPGFASPIRAFQNSLYHMRKSNDVGTNCPGLLGCIRSGSELWSG